MKYVPLTVAHIMIGVVVTILCLEFDSLQPIWVMLLYWPLSYFGWKLGTNQTED